MMTEPARDVAATAAIFGFVASAWFGWAQERLRSWLTYRKGSVMDRTSLTALIQEHLALARDASSGRSAHTVYGGHARTLRQTLIALTHGRRLDDHENPGEATLHVLHGRVRLTAGGTSAEGETGDLLIIPDARHALEALDDSAVLLTVAKR